MNYLMGGMIGGVGAASVVKFGDSAPLLSRILPFTPSYLSEVALGVAVMAIGEILYRIIYRSVWKLAIDKSIFDTMLKRYQVE